MPGLDLELILLASAAVVGIVVGVLHLVGYVPPRYRSMLRDVQSSTATSIAEALEARLARWTGNAGEDGPDPLIELRDGLATLQQAITQVAPQVGMEVTKALSQAQADLPPMPDPSLAFKPLTDRLDALPTAIGEQLTLSLGKAQEDAMKQLESHGIPPEVTGAMGATVSNSNRRFGDLKNAVGQGLLGPYGALLQQFMPPLYDYLVENPDMVVQALEMPVVQKLIQKAAAMAGGLKESVGGWGT